MDNQILGALLGLVFAMLNYILMGTIIRKKEAMTGNDRDPATGKSVVILEWVRKFDLVLLPAVFYFAFGFIEGRIIG